MTANLRVLYQEHVSVKQKREVCSSELELPYDLLVRLLTVKRLTLEALPHIGPRFEKGKSNYIPFSQTMLFTQCRELYLHMLFSYGTVGSWEMAGSCFSLGYFNGKAVNRYSGEILLQRYAWFGIGLSKLLIGFFLE